LAPQLEHLFSFIKKQQTRPTGKQQMPRQMPQQVNLSNTMPLWHEGQVPWLPKPPGAVTTVAAG